MLIPENSGEATTIIDKFVPHHLQDLHVLKHSDFLILWHAVAYLNPALHPDGYETEDSGWPDELRPVAAEAWRRSGVGTLTDAELYPADAAWAGVCDQMSHPPADAVSRRRRINQLSTRIHEDLVS